MEAAGRWAGGNGSVFIYKKDIAFFRGENRQGYAADAAKNKGFAKEHAFRQLGDYGDASPGPKELCRSLLWDLRYDIHIRFCRNVFPLL